MPQVLPKAAGEVTIAIANEFVRKTIVPNDMYKEKSRNLRNQQLAIAHGTWNALCCFADMFNNSHQCIVTFFGETQVCHEVDGV